MSTDLESLSWPAVERIVAAHQPTFLPWLGLFDKLVKTDVLVLLDDVQFPRSSAGNWMNRVRVLVDGRPAWITVPIVRAGRGIQIVRDVEIDDTQPWRERLLRTLRHNYSRAEAYKETFGLVRELVETPTTLLADYNERNFRRLAEELGLDTSKLVRSSTMPTAATGTDRLIALTRGAGGTVYLSGDGSEQYLEQRKFGDGAPELRFQRYRHPVYRQLAPAPVAGLSIVDALLNLGIVATRKLLRS